MWWYSLLYLWHFSLDVNHIRRICLIKTLLVKNPIRKPSEGKRVQYYDNSLSCSWYVRTVSLKTLLVKPNGTKFGQRERKGQYNDTLLQANSPSCWYPWVDAFQSCVLTSLMLRLAMTLWINLLDYHLSVFVAHQFHHFSNVHVYKIILMKCV